jgi:hypothetical protein
MADDITLPTGLSKQETAAIARHAGLVFNDERLPSLTRELNIARAAADELLRVDPADIAGVGVAFDPTWSSEQNRGAR